MKYLLFSLVGLLVLLQTACEREHRSYGGVSTPLPGAPEYAASAEVATLPGVSFVKAVAPGGNQEAVIDGAALYAKSCAACHQATGAGIPGVFPPLDKSPYVIGDNIERLAAIMVYGLAGPIEVLGTTYNSAMAGLGSQLNDEELAAVASYIRSSWSNSAGEVAAETFSAVREKYGSRGPFAIQDLGEEK